MIKKDYLSKFKEILSVNEEVSEIEMTSGNYDDDGKLIKGDIPTITTEFCEIGIYKKTVYFVFIIHSDTYSKKVFDSLKGFSNVQFYGFKNFKDNLYPKSDFYYKEFEKGIEKDKYFQIQFNYDFNKILPELLHKEYLKIKDILIKNKAGIINQITFNEK